MCWFKACAGITSSYLHFSEQGPHNRAVVEHSQVPLATTQANRKMLCKSCTRVRNKHYAGFSGNSHWTQEHNFWPVWVQKTSFPRGFGDYFRVGKLYRLRCPHLALCEKLKYRLKKSRTVCLTPQPVLAGGATIPQVIYQARHVHHSKLLLSTATE